MNDAPTRTRLRMGRVKQESRQDENGVTNEELDILLADGLSTATITVSGFIDAFGNHMPDGTEVALYTNLADTTGTTIDDTPGSGGDIGGGTPDPNVPGRGGKGCSRSGANKRPLEVPIGEGDRSRMGRVAEQSYDPIVPVKVGNRRAWRASRAATLPTGGKGGTGRRVD